MQSPAPTPRPRIDEAWLREWVAFGMLDLAVYLTKHAAFASYLNDRDQGTKRPARAKRR
jgi:hypothetical protein